ncbi:rhodanese-like domain-containing protein [Nocardioides stalactiti]|uniref:rhodanese-like domain-containing protein n=1 Tax=Nocardioides stalactiti TaxID=2755356 RepID=UPI0028AA24DD|nr:rhodanese-like domain-containing protein [Nocardioides stalactiti]
MRIPTVTVDGVPDPMPEQLTVIDVREDMEWQAGHIQGSVHIPLMQLPDRLGEMPEGQILVVCKVGGRSARAVAYLAQNGHDAFNLDGGLLDWDAAGRPLVTDSGATPYVA